MVIVVTEKHQNNCFIQVKPPFLVVEGIVFPPVPKKGMVKFPGKGHFKRVTTG